MWSTGSLYLGYSLSLLEPSEGSLDVYVLLLLLMFDWRFDLYSLADGDPGS